MAAIHSPDDSQAVETALRTCQDAQLLIDINSEHLEDLRTKMATTSELTKQEIRTLEGKLIKHFSKQLITKAALGTTGSNQLSAYPSLRQWLKVVGVTQESVEILEKSVSSLEVLKEKPESELDRLLLQTRLSVSQRTEDLRRLSRALQNLRKYTDLLLNGMSATDVRNLELYWESWDSTASNQNAAVITNSKNYHSHHHHHHHPKQQKVERNSNAHSRRDESASPKHDKSLSQNIMDLNSGGVQGQGQGWPMPNSMKAIPKADSTASSLSSCSSIPPPSPGLTLSPPALLPHYDRKVTPPTTPQWAVVVQQPSGGGNGNNGVKKESIPSSSSGKTPPPVRKHSTGIQKADVGHLIKSKSHESELANRVTTTPNAKDLALANAAIHEHNNVVDGEVQNQSSPSMAAPLPPPPSAQPTRLAFTSNTTMITSQSSSASHVTSTTHSSGMKTSASDMSSFSVVSSANTDNNRINNSISGDTVTTAASSTHKTVFRQQRLPTEPVLDSINHHGGFGGPSPIASPKSPPTYYDPNETYRGPLSSSSPSSANSQHQQTLQVPKSPRTPRSVGHNIKHRFTKTYKPGKCALCGEVMINGLKCKECKYKCHRDCEPSVPPSCGLPEGFVNFYYHQWTMKGSPIMPRPVINMTGGGGAGSAGSGGSDRGPPMGGMGMGPEGIAAGRPFVIGASHNPNLHIPSFQDSSSTSSCNSSTPSSPAVMVTSQPTTPHSASVYHNSRTKFTFPDPAISLMLHQQEDYSRQQQLQQQHIQMQMHPQQQQQFQQQQQQQQHLQLQHHQQSKVSSPSLVVDSVKSNDSDKTLSGSSGSGNTAYRLDSQDSMQSVDDSSNSWMATRQTSISMREWDIPYEDLRIGDKIGSGRFSTVHQGQWFGDVAVKILDLENIEDSEATLEAFRLDVATYRNTRHENVILFMGACMNPPKLAIVTSLCKGNTLFTHLHLRKDKFPMNKILIIAQQIAQGMGYLHHKGIIHKDLKTKNIFLENGRAIITDFGLVNVARRLCARQVGLEFSSALTQKECMSIPKGWLCYLAPEIMRALKVQPNEGEDLPFTKASDIYAFGTIWFEMLTGEWPWKDQPPETIIWMVGKGMRPTLANLTASKDVKDILVMCWTFPPENRPEFALLSNSLEKIPKKRLARSPSHPVHLVTRSAESSF